MRDEGIDLSRLNAPERVVLGLLAQGHTAKSIATITGRSVGAVNERLREARRKTGVGSSRELARIVAAQENRDELIGVAPAADIAPERPGSATTRRLRKGALVMSIVLAGLLAVGIVVAPQGREARTPAPSVPLPSEARSGQLDPTYWNSEYWHRRFAAERRDDQWAADAEVALRKRLARVPDLDGAGHPLAIRCATAVCEVTGTLSGDDRRKSAMLDEVQTAAGIPVPSVPPLSVVAFEVTVDQGKAPGFVIHFKRDYQPG